MQAHVIANAKQSMQTTTAIPEVANAASDGDAHLDQSGIGELPFTFHSLLKL
jgi:hypothetical protein